jgi:hypothetical protein
MTILRALVVVEFDVGIGQVPRLVVPSDALSAAEAAKLAYLALPDSNASVHNDLVYCFRFRTDSLPLFATTAMGHQYSFGCAFFRQQRDRSSARGFIQKSVVAVAQLPYVGLLKKLVCVVGPRLFAAAASGSPDAPRLLLSAAFDEVASWPKLVPGTTVLLPLLGEYLPCQVPWTGLENYRPSFVASSRPYPGGQHHGRHAAVRSGSVASSLSNAAFSASFASLSPTEALEADFGALSAVHEEAAMDAEAGQQSSATRSAGVSPALMPTAGASDAVERLDALSPRPQLGGAGPALSLAEVFAAKSLELAGLFQEVGLYSVFRGLSAHLWHLWELVITGQPIMVIGASPALCGDAVLALVSLISPLEFCADYRPYFTLFDPDFQQVAAMLDAHHPQISGQPRAPGLTRAPRHVRVLQPGARGGNGNAQPPLSVPEPDLDPRLLRLQPQHPLIIGSTNPYFTKALQCWPNAVWLGSPGTPPTPAVSGGSGERVRSASLVRAPDASAPAGAAMHAATSGAFSTPRKADAAAKGSSASLFHTNIRRSGGTNEAPKGSFFGSPSAVTGVVDTSSFAIGPAESSAGSNSISLGLSLSASRDSDAAHLASLQAGSGGATAISSLRGISGSASHSITRSSEGVGRRRASSSAIAAPASLSGVLKVVSTATPLFDVLPTSSLHHWPSRDGRAETASALGGGARPPGPGAPLAADHGCIVVRRSALVHPDRSLLRQLYRTPLSSSVASSTVDSSTLSAAAASSPVSRAAHAAGTPASPVATSPRQTGGAGGHDYEPGVPGSVRSRCSDHSGSGAEHPAVAINNVILRQHFRSLTLAFVAPFEPYFTLDPR